MTATVLGFAGLGVMGEAICKNILSKSGAEMHVFDLKPEPVSRMQALGATAAASIGDLSSKVDILFLSLPGGPEVEAVIRSPGGILEQGRPGLLLVDTSTTPVSLTRELATELAKCGIDFIDAPVARTRQAAQEGTLSIMVGGSDEAYLRLCPLLAYAATDITHCGPVGCGQVVKVLNNMVLIETVVALSEALALSKAAGVDQELLLETLSKGSADSFALRNHGMKAMLPGKFPTGAFPTNYALKDISYAIDLARMTGFRIPGAELAQTRMQKACDQGYADNYFPVLIQVTDRT